jgi:hypothetical protein
MKLNERKFVHQRNIKKTCNIALQLLFLVIAHTQPAEESACGMNKRPNPPPEGAGDHSPEADHLGFVSSFHLVEKVENMISRSGCD